MFCEHVLEEGRCAGAAEHEPSHVRDVEEAGAAAGGEVLGDDPGRVLDGHLPAAEVDHPRARGLVPGVERRAQQALLAAQPAALRVAHCAHSLSLPRPSPMSSELMPE